MTTFAEHADAGWRRWAGCLALVAAVVTMSTTSLGDAETARGLAFSDELGGFRILSVTGSGARDDPYVVVEEITDNGPVALVIRRSRAGLGSIHRPPASRSFTLTKVVINRSGRKWLEFDLELREVLNQRSDYMDGLSFDQPMQSPRPFLSDRFDVVREVREPYDGLKFWHGAVAVGEAVRFSIQITDPTPTAVFYLIQQSNWLVASTK